MNILKDIANIKKSYKAVSRWKILATAFYKPTSYYLADVYLLLSLFILAVISGFLFDHLLILLLVGLLMACLVWRIRVALESIYSQLKSDPKTEKSYRKDLMYLRMHLFKKKLENLKISPKRGKELLHIVRLESEKAQAHPHSVTRPAFTIPLTLFISILAARAGLDKFWTGGEAFITLLVLGVIMYFTYMFLDLLHPDSYYAKEFEIFLEIYCSPD